VHATFARWKSMNSRSNEEKQDPSRRAPYERPELEHLGSWSALTLQQSVPIGPGGFNVNLERTSKPA
jgi:hypothetical protein